VNDERPDLAPLRHRMRGLGAPLPSRTAALVVAVALVAFVAGLQVSPTRVVTVTAPAPSGSPTSALASEQGAFAPTATPVALPSPLPVGVYHVTQAEAAGIALAARFYAAYNAGQLATVMALLSAQPVLVDCDYVTGRLVSYAGRSAIEAGLRTRFAEHDRWTVEFYQENPGGNGQIVVIPIERSSDTLRHLGAPGGAKQSFPEDFYLGFSPDHAHFDVIAWNTMPASVGALCSP
jgi:hypothetical protein